jgi:hypothetical protein
MLCHGELVRLRPQPRYLTSFYLMISAGGALGGLLVSLVAPQVFNTYAEWKIGMTAGVVLAATVAFVLTESPGPRPARRSSGRHVWLSLPGALRVGGLLAASLALVEIIQMMRNDRPSHDRIVELRRNFYGVLMVLDASRGDPPIHARELYNGRTLHGLQLSDPKKRHIATTYYSVNSGIGQTLKYYKDESARSGKPLRVGVVGLGVGTLAAYFYRPGHTVRFYEINPDDSRMAETYFNYLADARQRSATVEIVQGDARLSLERELKQAPQAFDLLVLDAFSSDSIPTHLLTRESFDVYLQHLTPESAVAIHTSNRYLNLAPVVFGLAEHFKLDAVRILSDDLRNCGAGAEWIVLSRNKELLRMLRAFDGNSKLDPPTPPLPLWTDGRHNLLETLR